MRKPFTEVVLYLLLTSFGTNAFAESQRDIEDSALEATESWLAVVDKGNYADSWDLSASLFRGKVTRENWADELTALRTSIGGFKSRSLIGAKYVKNLPDAPEGEYVVVQYESIYTVHKSVLETVVPMRDPDSVWRVSGYFIRGNTSTHTTPN